MLPCRRTVALLRHPSHSFDAISKCSLKLMHRGRIGEASLAQKGRCRRSRRSRYLGWAGGVSGKDTARSFFFKWEWVEWKVVCKTRTQSLQWHNSVQAFGFPRTLLQAGCYKKEKEVFSGHDVESWWGLPCAIDVRCRADARIQWHPAFLYEQEAIKWLHYSIDDTKTASGPYLSLYRETESPFQQRVKKTIDSHCINSGNKLKM